MNNSGNYSWYLKYKLLYIRYILNQNYEINRFIFLFQYSSLWQRNDPKIILFCYT
ncbi:hypothetical protein LX73_1898 [Fodinibius salinus]|uniref:Uncharacterized protein n=1 Tax=Fodinibius salinus TaxID=860790 RepID=A0A5D3YJB4_9BACT|nr:hypothetical protein LX73_1898 [Fodinibius salinus]